jgi:CRP/FNR family cyclic AMP-dependent transcriptional regulator
MFTITSFEQCLGSVLIAESAAPTRRIARRRNVYAVGSRDDQVYFITEGRVKVITQSQAGRECLLAIYTAGDFFGECCLSGIRRSETAIAMSDTVLKQVTGVRFLALMVQASLLGDFVRYLAARLVEQQQVITDLATLDCEHRLAAWLLRLSRKLGVCEDGVLAQRISHQELSQMVGTTRPRISEFMLRFRDRGLIDMTPDSRILVKERFLQQYLEESGLELRLSAAASAK